MGEVLRLTLEPRGPAGAFVLTDGPGSTRPPGQPPPSRRWPSSHRRECVRRVTEATREQTRSDRVATAIGMIRTGRTRT